MAYEQQIAKGVALLDEKMPGWLERVDIDRLDLQADTFPSDGSDYPSPRGALGCGCVLSQLDYDTERGYGSYFERAKSLGLASEPFNGGWMMHHASHYGFTISPSVLGKEHDSDDVEDPGAAQFAALTAEWKATILRLRSERA
jgi:hypothetical protein